MQSSRKYLRCTGSELTVLRALYFAFLDSKIAIILTSRLRRRQNVISVPVPVSHQEEMLVFFVFLMVFQVAYPASKWPVNCVRVVF